MIKAVLFDFDGTLVDSTNSIWKEYRRVARLMKLNPVTKRDFINQLGKPWKAALESLWPDVDISEFNRHYRRGAESSLPIEGVPEVLLQLKRRYELGILTSRGEKTLFKHLALTGIDSKLFDLILHKDSLKNHKPNPLALHQAAQELGLRKNELVYIGDSVVDAECSKKAGIRFVGVLTGGTTKKDFMKHGVKHILKSIAELLDTINRIELRAD